MYFFKFWYVTHIPCDALFKHVWKILPLGLVDCSYYVCCNVPIVNLSICFIRKKVKYHIEVYTTAGTFC